MNGQIFREKARETAHQRTPIQVSATPNISKKTKPVAHSRHKIFIIGDSHVRGLLEMFRNKLNDAFSVIGINKPNVFIDVITFPVHLTDNLTKKYLIIFYGGTKDISNNESKNGL